MVLLATVTRHDPPEMFAGHSWQLCTVGDFTQDFPSTTKKLVTQCLLDPGSPSFWGNYLWMRLIARRKGSVLDRRNLHKVLANQPGFGSLNGQADIPQGDS